MIQCFKIGSNLPAYVWFIFMFSSYFDGEKDFERVLELRAAHATAEKELSQLHQAKSTLDLATSSFESGDVAKAQEYLDKVVLVLSPDCSKVLYFLTQIWFS